MATSEVSHSGAIGGVGSALLVLVPAGAAEVEKRKGRGKKGGAFRGPCPPQLMVQVPWLWSLGDAARKRVLNWCRSPGCEAWVTQLAREGGGVLNWCRSLGCEAWVTQLAREGGVGGWVGGVGMRR